MEIIIFEYYLLEWKMEKHPVDRVRYIYTQKSIYKDRIKRKERTSGDVEGRERVHVCFVFGDSARTEGDESARGSETSARFNAAVP